MDIVNIKESKSVRVDKNFGHNITDFKKYSSYDQRILKTMIVYMSLTFQKNLFGLVEISLSDFSNKMKIPRTALVAKHKDPIYFKVSSKTEKELIELEEKHGKMSEHRIWQSVFENTLFILKYEKILGSYLTKKNDTKTVSINDFSYIKSLHLSFKKTGKTKKLIYHYQPTEEFEQSMTKFFFNINLKTFIEVREHNLDDWYLSLMNRINNENLKGINKLEFTIQLFSDLLNVKNSTLYDQNSERAFSNIKRNCDKKFNEKFIPIVKNEIDNLKLNWIKGPKAKYSNIAVVSWRGENKIEIKKKNDAIYDDLFYSEYFKELSLFYNNEYALFETEDIAKYQGYIQWLLSYKDINIKESNYIAIYTKLKGNKKDLDHQCRSFVSSLSQIYSIICKDPSFIYYEDLKFHMKLIIKNEVKVYSFMNVKDFMLKFYNERNFFENYYSQLNKN